MNMIKNRFTGMIAMCLITAGVASASQDGGPSGHSQAFDFISAWGVHRGPDAAMALIPNDDCIQGDHQGLCASYEVGTSIVSGNGESPSFERYGALSDLSLWEIPAEYGRWEGDLREFQGPDGSRPFQGKALFVDVLFAGWLSTPTGYESYVTGILTINRFDFKAPERIVVGSMFLEPQKEWQYASDGFDAMQKIADSLNGVHDLLSTPVPMINGNDGCFDLYRDQKQECIREARRRLQRANNELENCLADIGFWDRILGAGAGAAAGGAGGAGIGAGVGAFGAGAGAVPGAAIGGAIGGLGGAIGGFFGGPSYAKDKCYNKHRSVTRNCNEEYQDCLDMALDDLIDCLAG